MNKNINNSEKFSEKLLPDANKFDEADFEK